MGKNESLLSPNHVRERGKQATKADMKYESYSVIERELLWLNISKLNLSVILLHILCS